MPSEYSNGMAHKSPGCWDCVSGPVSQEGQVNAYVRIRVNRGLSFAKIPYPSSYSLDHEARLKSIHPYVNWNDLNGFVGTRAQEDKRTQACRWHFHIQAQGAMPQGLWKTF